MLDAMCAFSISAMHGRVTHTRTSMPPGPGSGFSGSTYSTKPGWPYSLYEK